MKHRLCQFISQLAGSKRRLEWLLAVGVVFAFYLYAWVYQSLLGLNLPFVEFNGLLDIPVIAVILLPLLHRLWISPDPLQRSHLPWASVRFFQAQFPSNYIRDRCQRCVETARSCRNFIDPKSSDHVAYWLHDIWRPVIGAKHPERFEETFRKGYTCKLVVGFNLALGVLGALGLVTLFVAYAAYRLGPRLQPFPYSPFYVIYPSVCFSIAAISGLFHSPDAQRPTGCWHAWREINQAHVLWLRHNEHLLVEKVCRAGGNDKVFRLKQGGNS